MDIAMIGLGRMGGNMVRRLQPDGHRVVVWDPNQDAVNELAQAGAVGATSLEDVVGKLAPPRAVWIMVPAGDPVEQTLNKLLPLLSEGDVIVDGGNSNFHDTIRRHAKAKESGVHYVDVGVSGGVWGLKVGYCCMAGGEKAAFEIVEPAIKTLAPPDGYHYCGPAGSGHYVKMVHNGIEYGMLQAYAEGFEILEASRYDLDLHAISHLWNQGSVVRSWLLELCENVFADDPHLDKLGDAVADSGEGRWTIQEAMDLDVPAPVITLSLLARFRSRQESSFAGKVIAGLRNQFGGHAVEKILDVTPESKDTGH